MRRSLQAGPQLGDGEASPPEAGFVQRAITALAITVEYFSSRNALENSMKDHVREQLLECKLTAFGCKADQKNTYAAKKIAGDFWRDADIDWANNSAANSVEQFSRITIINVNDHAALSNSSRIGRPTNKAIIFSAIEAATKEFPEFHEFQNKQKIKIIRKLISDHHSSISPFGSGMGDDAIRKHISGYQKRK